MAGFFDNVRSRMAQQQQPTAAPATPPGMAPAAAPQAPAASTFGGWNADNAFADWDPQALSTQTGMSTDDLRTGRSSYQADTEGRYRQAMAGRGQQADATSANLFQSPDFLSFARTGQLGPQQAPQGGGQTLGSLGPASSQYGSGSAIAPFTGQFQAPSAQEAIGTPGMQYALDRAKQAIERSAAAKGTLLTGGTLKDLSENQIGMALQGYQQAYGNKRSEFDLGRSIFESNQDRPFAKYSTLAELGRPV